MKDNSPRKMVIFSILALMMIVGTVFVSTQATAYDWNDPENAERENDSEDSRESAENWWNWTIGLIMGNLLFVGLGLVIYFNTGDRKKSKKKDK